MLHLQRPPANDNASKPVAVAGPSRTDPLGDPRESAGRGRGDMARYVGYSSLSELAVRLFIEITLHIPAARSG